MDAMPALALVEATRAAGWGPGPWWPIFPLVWILFWGAVVFALFRFRRGWPGRNAGSSGEAVLGERYARGEISEQEYRDRLAVLRERAR